IMSGFDWVIALIFVVSVIVGIWRGFIKEALSLSSWILAFWFGNAFCREAGDFLAQYVNIPTETFRIWAGFTLVFLLTLFIFAILTFIVTKLFLHGPVKSLDRILGIGFGGLRAVAIVVLILWGVRGFGMNESAWWANSQYIPHFIPVVDYVESLMPESFQRDEAKEEESLQSQVLKGVIEQNLPPEITEPAPSTENQ
ncbi:MAG: CvpA family protein, partial [Pseudomonadota bacterium]